MYSTKNVESELKTCPLSVKVRTFLRGFTEVQLWTVMNKSKNWVLVRRHYFWTWTSSFRWWWNTASPSGLCTTRTRTTPLCSYTGGTSALGGARPTPGTGRIGKWWLWRSAFGPWTGWRSEVPRNNKTQRRTRVISLKLASILSRNPKSTLPEFFWLVSGLYC